MYVPQLLQLLLQVLLLMNPPATWAALQENCSPSPCLNSGTCQPEESVEGFSCQCPVGYAGSRCQTDLDDCAAFTGADDLCANGGRCVDGVGTYTCECAPGYSGDRCTVTINECASSPCRHGGTCVDAADSYRCDCAPGFIGDVCQVRPPSGRNCACCGACKLITIRK